MTNKPLIEPSELATQLAEPDLRILDIRSSVDGGARAAYEAGHVPGAIHTDYVTDGWRMSKDGAAGLLPDAEALSRLFGRLGLTPRSRIVIVSAGTSSGDFSAAARVYWTLKVAGHANLALLDGGFARWTAEGRPVETGPGKMPTPTDDPVSLDPSLRATLERVEQVVAAGRTPANPVLLDSRGPKSFAGDEKSPQATRAGRLPGALNLDAASLYDPAKNRARSREELEKLAAAVPAGPTITYCNSGHAAATDWFVLSELLGRPDVALYDGSMSQWTQDPGHKVETGPAKPE